MSQAHAYEEGTPEELVPYLAKHPNQRFRLIPLEPEKEKPRPKGRMIYEGMFPELRDLSEEDFKCAEWHGKEEEY
jgi:hypothetical protein